MPRRRLLLATGLTLSAAGGLLALAPHGPAVASADRVRAEGALVRYDTSAVPAGATARVQAVATGSDATVVTLHVRGLTPGRTYGAHVHVRACGASDPAAAGGHYQDQVAPPGQAAKRFYANPDNEIWLDVTPDAAGNGSAQTRVEWRTRAGGAGSVMLHAAPTSAVEDMAGTAGPRVGCLTVGF